jgi:hypothetical protein
MRIEKEEGKPARREIGSACDCRKRRGLSGRPALIGCDHVASRAPSAREPLAIAGIRSERRDGRHHGAKHPENATRNGKTSHD